MFNFALFVAKNQECSESKNQMKWIVNASSEGPSQVE